MAKKRRLSPQSVWDSDAVSAAFSAAGVKPAHITKLYHHLITNPGSSWSDVPKFPKAALAALDANFTMFTTKLIHRQTAADGETTKLLVELQDGFQCEAVIMSYDTTGKDPDAETGSKRATLCVSSQVGCQMGCTFCATGTMGLIADLTAGEIIEELVHANAVSSIRNVVFMGMGEPLNNYAAVKAAVSLMTHPQAFALRQRSVTVSTVGVIPYIAKLAEDLPRVSLALSLHAPTQELRQTIVPSATSFKLDRLILAIDAYQVKTGQRVFIEYVVLGPDFNCTEKHAHQLGELLRGKDVVINLIPWNPILSPGMDFGAPPPGAIAAFQAVLKIYDLPSTVRQEKGQDVAAACGQLVLEHQAGGGGNKGKGCGDGDRIRDLEDLVGDVGVGVSGSQETSAPLSGRLRRFFGLAKS